jgi:hypothetical protein
MVANIRASALTFKKCTLEKLAFLMLNLIDMCLTLFATSQGARELNPFMHNLFSTPYQIYIFKFFIPLLLAWMLPGKFLIPSIALLTFVVGWDIKELIVYYF